MTLQFYKKCVICKKSLAFNTTNAKCCSSRCSMKYYQKRNKEKIQQYNHKYYLEKTKLKREKLRKFR